MQLNKSNIIQVFEHERLTINPDAFKRSISKKQLEALYRFNDKNGNKYFTGIRNGVKFNSYVGVVQIGKLTIEILPKADKEGYSTVQAAQWRNVLLSMLKQTNSLKVESLTDASLKRKNHSLLDLYIAQYIKELQKLVRNGLIKKYRRNQGNQLALKGRLDFTKNIQQNLIHKERFYVHYSTYDQQHFLHIVLLKALNVLNIVDSSGQFSNQIKTLKLNFPELEHIDFPLAKLENYRFTRKTETYKSAFQIAKMLLLNYSPSLSSGEENMMALIFDMNKLWEKYVLKQLRNTEQDQFHVKGQDSALFWKADNVSRTIQPDIVLVDKTDSRKKIIIDTKWKIVDALNPSDDDLKQMFAYNMYWGAKRSILLYPWVGQNEKGYGDYVINEGHNNQCKLGFVNVMNENGALNKFMGLDVFKKIN